MCNEPADPPPTLPTDLVLLQSHRRAALARQIGCFDAVAVVIALQVGLCVGVWFPLWPPALPAALHGVLAWGLILTAWLLGRLAWPRARPAAADADRFARLLVGEALLTQRRAGLLRLTPSSEGLRA